MASDSERREEARGLRGLVPCRFDDGEYIDCGEVEEALGLVNDDGAWYKADSVMRLADFVEPSEPKVRCVAEVKVDGERLEELVHDAAVELTGIDREALLALADELDKDADNIISAARNARFTGGGPRMGEAKHDACEWRCIARRIREALEVTGNAQLG